MRRGWEGVSRGGGEKVDELFLDAVRQFQRISAILTRYRIKVLIILYYNEIPEFFYGVCYDSWDRIFILIIYRTYMYILYTIFYVEYYTLYKSVQSQ